MALLLGTRRAHRQQPFHKLVARGALRPKTALAPQHRGPQRALGGVVRRFHALYIEEGPQRPPTLQQLVAEAHGFRQRHLLPLLQQSVHLLLHRLQAPPQFAPVDRAAPKLVPVGEQCCYLLQQLSGPRLHPPLAFTKPSDVALQMGPTELAARHRPNIVGRQAVGTQHPLEPSQQRTQRRLIAPSSNSEHGADPANRDPQPTALTRLLPTGLVGIRDLLPRQRLLYLL